jgi:hypothetical protein
MGMESFKPLESDCGSDRVDGVPGQAPSIVDHRPILKFVI